MEGELEMKKKTLITIIMSFVLMAREVPQPALANEKADARTTEANNLQTELADNQDQLQQAYDAGKQLAAEFARYIATKELLDGAKANYLKQREELEADAAALGQRIDRHNSNKPDPKDRGRVESYNAEAAQLESGRSRMVDHSRTLEDTRVGLLQRYRDLSDATTANFQKRKTNRALFNDLLEARNRIKARLSELQRQVADCKRLLAQRGPGSNEYLKNQCGNVQFDGTDPGLPPPPPDPPMQ